MERETDALTSASSLGHFGALAELLRTSVAPAESRRSLWSPLSARVDSFRRLDRDWSGEDSVAPSRSVIAGAHSFLSTLECDRQYSPPTRVSATPYGSIVFEWLVPDGPYLAAEIENPVKAEWMYKPRNGPSRHWKSSLGSPTVAPEPAVARDTIGTSVAIPPPWIVTGTVSANTISLHDAA